MTPSLTDTSMQLRDAAVTRRVGQQRLATGLAQGALLYFLYHAHKGGAWLASEPYLFFPLTLLALILPVLLISGLGHLTRRQLGLWMLTAGLVLVLFALHDAWRNAGLDVAGRAGRMVPGQPSFLVVTFSMAFFFIAHSLVQAGAHDGKRLARYASYFESAWKLSIQLLFSAFFVGILWLVLWLGAILFNLLKLDGLQRLLGESWFAVPVTFFAFSSAMHITDVRPAIVRGIRTLLLVLMSWILPVAALLATGFLLSLPFTGLDVLWQTRHATAVLLGTDAALIVLINAAFQTGEAQDAVAAVVHFAARIAAALLLPLTALGVYALSLRVGDHGWTTDRVIGAACLLVALAYALGYGYASLRRGHWVGAVRQVNVAAALLVLAVLFALFTPLADPARISVNNQMARLEAGIVKAADFDYGFLRFQGARYGKLALQELKGRQTGPDAALLRERAAQMQTRQYSGYVAEDVGLDIASNLHTWPRGSALPASFPLKDWNKGDLRGNLPLCLTKPEHVCDVFVLDMEGDGGKDLLLIGERSYTGAVLLTEAKAGKWKVLAHLPHDVAGCEPLLKKLREGDFQLVAPRMREIDLGGARVSMRPEGLPIAGVCAALKTAK